MTLSTSRTVYGDIVVVALRGGGDPDGTRLRAALDKTLASRPQAMIVNLAGTKLPEAAVPRLLDAARVAHLQGCRVAVCGLSEEGLEQLHTEPGGRRLPAYDSVEDATQGLLLAGI